MNEVERREGERMASSDDGSHFVPSRPFVT